MAAAASWIETFKLPLREIRKRFRKSELILMAWRSQEISANMDKLHSNTTQQSGTGYKGDYVNPNNIIETEDGYILPEGTNNGIKIPKRFFDEEGELNLSKVTGDEAVTYLNALGLNIGGRSVMGG